ncbi:hypothetical protein RDABS01_000407 [Bienertia sinuspersici]
MARFGHTLRRRDKEFFQFLIVMINVVNLVYLMMEESSGSGGNTMGGRGKNKRFWSAEEDKALVAALHELSVDPHWKCDNGFRNGYMVRLEELIGKAMPGCGLKASPHIDSRLKTLVSKFRAILLMLGTSGFKWDDQRHMISVERSAYDEFCKAHPSCKNLYGVAFPHLNVMMEIYGKDYATGKPAEGFEEAVINIEIEDNVEAQVLAESEEDDNGLSQTFESTPVSKKVKRERAKKKGKSGESFSNPEACLQLFMKEMNTHLSTMANVWVRADEREQELTNKNNKVLGELLQLDDLSPTEALEAANILTAQPHKLTVFFNCPPLLKKEYVKSLLG